MFPPEMTATNRLFFPCRLFLRICALRPARDSAPDGSGIDLVSGHQLDELEWDVEVRRRTFENILDGGTDLVVVDLHNTICQFLQ